MLVGVSDKWWPAAWWRPSMRWGTTPKKPPPCWPTWCVWPRTQVLRPGVSNSKQRCRCIIHLCRSMRPTCCHNTATYSIGSLSRHRLAMLSRLSLLVIENSCKEDVLSWQIHELEVLDDNSLTMHAAQLIKRQHFSIERAPYILQLILHCWLPVLGTPFCGVWAFIYIYIYDYIFFDHYYCYSCLVLYIHSFLPLLVHIGSDIHGYLFVSGFVYANIRNLGHGYLGNLSRETMTGLDEATRGVCTQEVARLCWVTSQVLARVGFHLSQK